MSPLISFGIATVIALQALGLWLTGPMKCFSFLGSEPVFTFIIPLIYWCFDTALGLRLAFILLGSVGLNELVKLPLHGPRPYWLSSDVRALSSQTSFGVPSGHAQISAAFWGMIAAQVGKAWVWIAALLLMALIGLSRLYLGVHFPHDVGVGFLLGFLTLWAFRKFWNPVAARVKALSPGGQIGLSFAVSLGMLLIGALLAFLARDWVTPPAWIAAAMRSGPPPAPLSLNGLISASGTFFGQCLGLVFIAPRGGYSATGTIGRRALRFLVGLVGVLIIALGLKAVLPDGESLLPSGLRYVRYAALGFWVTGGAIWIFTKLHLTDNQVR